MSKEKTVIVEVVDAECAEGEAYHYPIPADTYWSDINIAVELFHPTASSVMIRNAEDKDE